MKRLLIVLVALLLASTAWSQNFWEGNAAIGGYGEFPDGGYYAASDSFERNSVVTVKNPSSGETVQVIVVKRLNDPSLFIVISPEAGQKIGLTGTQITPVRVERSGSGANLPGLSKDVPYSVDPDVNPAASVGDPNDLAFLGNVLAQDDLLGKEKDESALGEPVEPGTEAPEIVTDGVAPQEEVATVEPSDLPVGPEDETPAVTTSETGEPASGETVSGQTTEPELPPADTGEVTETTESTQSTETTEVAEGEGGPEVVLDGQVPEEGTLPETTTDTPEGTAESEETAPEVVLDGEVPVQGALPEDMAAPPSPEEEERETPLALSSESTPLESSVAADSEMDVPEVAADAAEEVPQPVLDGHHPVEESLAYQDDTVPGLPREDVPFALMGLGSAPVEEWLPLAITNDSPDIPLAEAPPLATADGELSPPAEGLPGETADIPSNPSEETPGVVADGVDYPPKEGQPDIALADEPTAAEKPKEVAEAPAETPKDTETVVYLEEAKEKPPQGNGTAEFASEGTTETESTTPATAVNAFLDLPEGTESQFVQVAAFREKSVADQLATRIGRVYPVRTVAATSGTAFRVLVGPLGPDESGALLRQFQRSGFPDAFIRKNL